ncbi:MAG: tetratricopeptide repeat protein [Chloroflexota bacterium]
MANSEVNLEELLMSILVAPAAAAVGITQALLRPAFQNGLKKQRKRDWAGAARDYTDMLRKDPNFWPAHYNRVMVLTEQFKFDEALVDVNLLLSRKPSYANAYVLRGNLHFALRDWKQAGVDFQRALALGVNPPLAAFIHTRLASLKLVAYDQHKPVNDPTRATWLDQAQAEVDIAFLIQAANVIALSSKAQIMKRRGDLSGALAVYQEAFRIAPYSVMLLTDRSTIYIEQENWAAALTDLDKAIYLSGGNGVAYNNRGFVYALQNELDKALADCNQAITLTPRLVNAYISRGLTYFLMDRLDAALADFQHSLALEPMNECAMAGTAITLHRLGRIDEARAQWQALVDFDAEYRDADTLKRVYHTADAFIEEARKVAALLQ